MPHYADGTAAREGDVVRGNGYNVKGEVVGIVTGLTPKQENCNLTIVIPDGAIGYFSITRGDHKTGGDSVVGHVITGKTEYGQTDHFVKVS